MTDFQRPEPPPMVARTISFSIELTGQIERATARLGVSFHAFVVAAVETALEERAHPEGSEKPFDRQSGATRSSKQE